MESFLEIQYNGSEQKMLLNDQEESDFCESMELVLQDILHDASPLHYHKYEFENIVRNEIYENFKYAMDEEVFHYYHDKLIEKVYCENAIIKRSFKEDDSIIYYNETHINQPDTVKYLKSVDQPEQRTAEWYEFRHNHLTGSNAWKAFGTESSRNQLFYEKLKPFEIPGDEQKNKELPSNISDNPLNWGHKYEPLSIQVYEKYNDVIVEEFGCIPHKTIPFLAASPDGIVTSNRLNGRMVEIKNVVSREITQIPKMEYYIQMQIQMEVCDLDSCDFIETKFVEYDSYEDFKQDEDNTERGMIVVIMHQNRFIYEYAPLFETDEETLDRFVDSVREKYDIDENNNNNDSLNHHIWFKNIYWKMDVYSCVLVLRNREWFREAYTIFSEFWNQVEEERKVVDSYKKYEPKRRTGTKSLSSSNTNTVENNEKSNDIGSNNLLQHVKVNNFVHPHLSHTIQESKMNDIVDLDKVSK